MTIFAEKSLGINPVSEQEMFIQITGFAVKGLLDRIIVDYRIGDKSSNGEKFYPISIGEYIRTNTPGNTKFDALKDSDLGKGIIAMLAQDLKSITSAETVDSDLKQE